MRITVGVDHASRTGIILDLIEALRFPRTEVDLIHVVERWDGVSSQDPYPLHMDLIEKYLRMQEEEGQKILSAGLDDARKRGFDPCRAHLALGFISNKLIDHTLTVGADLLALGTSGKRPLESVLIGSVSRKAVIGSRRSVLVVKAQAPTNRPLNVVAATDHSPYAEACLSKLAQWAPEGIGKLVLVTVFPEQLIKALSSMMDHFKADIASWIREELDKSNKRSLEPFEKLGYGCTSRVESGNVGDTLARVMAEEQADLLVVGAQGHGFIDRLTMGSISLDQVASRPYSVLILRQ